MLANSGQVMGIISEVAFSFMVHEPRLIIDVLSDRSLFSKLLRYRSIWVCSSYVGEPSENRKLLAISIGAFYQQYTVREKKKS